MQEHPTENLWEELQVAMKCKIPDCMKNLLKFMSFDNEISLAGLNESHFVIIEDQARTTMAAVITDILEREKYFGVFYKNPENFVILPGQKVLMLAIAKHFKDKLYEKQCKVKAVMPKFQKSSQRPYVPNEETNQSDNTTDERNSLNNGIKEEQQHLKTLLERWLDDWLQGAREQTSGLSSNINVSSAMEVFVKASPDNKPFCAEVKCCLGTCTSNPPLKLQKVKSRWSTSNYHRHVTRVHKKSLSQMPKKSSTTITHFTQLLRNGGNSSSSNKSAASASGSASDYALFEDGVSDMEAVTPKKQRSDVGNTEKNSAVANESAIIEICESICNNAKQSGLETTLEADSQNFR